MVSMLDDSVTYKVIVSIYDCKGPCQECTGSYSSKEFSIKCYCRCECHQQR